ncbi:MAG: hypothetical protein NBV76_05385 [Candidatus Ochrobactrum gambitense]|nr:MAG: hypothetical protein NBV76_05385 [Candidatus Ochrobactrum gambitense]WEK17195.1 MAG: hypothetical protein P0Y54_05575 [Candidatus Ochrobactrum gambitense]
MAKKATSTTAITSFKGFDADLKCRGFQFEIGKSYTVEGKTVVCENGFHAVSADDPFHVWDFYPVVDDKGRLSRYASVEQSGDMDEEKTEKGTKIASAMITIKAELTLPQFIKSAVARIVELTKGKDDNSGYSARIGSSGNYAQIGSSGDSAQIGSSGNYARIGSSGYSARIGSSGNYAQIGSSGNYAQIGSSGNYARIGSSGYSARIGSSGNYAQIGSSGNYARIGSSGYSARIGSSGDSAQIGSSGNYARIDASGKDAVIACSGSGSTVTAGEGAAICIPYHDGKRTRFAVGYVGEDGIEAGKAYRAENGKLVEA